MTKFLHIITSKNRGPQLEAQLRTLHFLKGSVSTKVVYTTTSEEHEAVYSYLKEQYPTVHFIREVDYKLDLETLIEEFEGPYVFITPDDGCFIREVDLEKVDALVSGKKIMYSLRMGTHLRMCHPAGNTPQPLPEFHDDRGEFKIWLWKGSSMDWSYPMALDGSVFVRDSFLVMLKSLSYNKPTSLEIRLQQFVGGLQDLMGAASNASQFVSIPWNAITDQAANLNAGISEELFLEEWCKGKRLCIDHIVGSMPVSCHYEYDLIWEDR